MFTVTEFRLIRKACPDDLTALLKKLNITEPDWNDGDEFKQCADLDEKIANKLSKLMKNDSVIGGYMDLLTLGKISFEYSETDNSLLEKIVHNRETIIQGSTRPQPGAKPQPIANNAAVSLQRNVRRVEQTQTSPIPIIIGGVVIAIGVGALFTGRTIAGIAAVLVGGVSAAVGLNGRKVVKEIVIESPQTMHPSKAPAPVASSSVYTANELKNVLEILSQVHKIVKAI